MPLAKHHSSNIIILFILLSVIYANSFSVPWQLDDPPNIIQNQPLFIKDLLPKTLWATFFAEPYNPGKLYRPIANLSFALNWFIGQDDPFGYHLVNLIIHLLTAAYLFKTTLLLLQLLNNSHGIAKNNHCFIALLSTVLWSTNPIQTQAVTYIVQRMASMGAMFFIFALYQYLLARQEKTFPLQIRHYITSGIYFAIALGCKENTITFIPSLLLIELTFFQRTTKSSPRILYFLIATNIILLLAGSHYIASNDLLKNFTKPIGSRPFSLFERLLTQPSILIFYISLIFYPAPSRLSIDHSWTISTSFLDPWTTTLSIIIIISTITYSIFKINKYQLFSFAILFYFINHIIESSIIPLEMIFEHRNYLPSMFLFLPLSCFAQKILNHRNNIKYGKITVTLLIPTTIFLFGVGTFNRNKIWTTEESIWTDALEKAKNNARPYAKLGEIYGWNKEKNTENLTKAIVLLEKATHLTSPRTSFEAALVGNIGKVYFNYGLFDLAATSYQRSLAINPNFIESRFDLASALAIQGHHIQALEQIDQVIAKNDLQSRFFNLRAQLLLWLNRPNEAVTDIQQAMHLAKINKERYFYPCGVALSKAGYSSQGYWFLIQALKQVPSDQRILYSLIENRLIADNTEQAHFFATQLIAQYGLSQIRNDFEVLPKDYTSMPINTALIKPVIDDAAFRALEAFH